MTLPSYRNLKPSGIEWLGEVPTHWTVARLRFHAELNPSKQEVAGLVPTTEVAFLPMEAVGEDGTLCLDQTRPLGELLSGYTYFAEQDVAYAKITPCFENGKGALMQGLKGGFGFGTTELTVLRARPSASPRFLWWLTQSAPFRKLGEAAMYGAGGQQRVPDAFARDFSPGWPPLEEQAAIATFLDRETAKIDTLIVQQQILMERLREKRQAVINTYLTKGVNTSAKMRPSGIEWIGDVPAHWDVVPIKWISPVQRGASPRPIEDPRYFDETGEYSWVRISDVSASQSILKETTQRLSDLGSSLSVRIQPGQLFVSIAGTVGKPCISGIKACIHDGFVYFPLLEMNPWWLFRVFESGQCYAGLGKLGTQLNLNTDTIGSILIPAPPPTEVTEILLVIEEEVAEIDLLHEEAETSISLLQEHRSALITAVVTGKVDVRGATA